MNIFALSVKSGISLAKLRKLEKLKALIVDKDDAQGAFLEHLIFHMRGNQVLTAAQLLTLYEAPELLDDLASAKPRYAARARAQVAALGDIRSAPVPREVTAAIVGASRGDDDEGLIIALWLASILPAEPVGHAWVVTRLLAPMNAFSREAQGPLISPALLNVRKLPEFAGCWRSEKIGSRNQIRYFSAPKFIDL